MSQSLVSVIIPVYNGEKYLAQAIESVLAQTYHKLEVIVVDDGSTDGTCGIAARFASSVHYTFQQQQGAGAARNHGIERASGSFYAFLDADDLWMEDKLTSQMTVFESDPDVDMVFGQMEQFHSPDLSEPARSRIAGGGDILAGYVPGTLLIKRDSFCRVGPFPTKWHIGEFIDWYSRAIDKGLKSYILPTVVTKRRLHGGNMTIQQRPAMIDYVRILKASLDRRRQNRDTISGA
jgi:glycosyltransferase involved in cell wall biosynthesis